MNRHLVSTGTYVPKIITGFSETLIILSMKGVNVDTINTGQFKSVLLFTIFI